MVDYMYQMCDAGYGPQKKMIVEWVDYMSRSFEEDHIQFTQVHWSDEANFHLSGHVNKKNMRF